MEYIKALNLTNSLQNVCSQSTQTLCSMFLPLLRRQQGIKARCWLMGLPESTIKLMWEVSVFSQA